MDFLALIMQYISCLYTTDRLFKAKKVLNEMALTSFMSTYYYAIIIIGYTFG